MFLGVVPEILAVNQMCGILGIIGINRTVPINYEAVFEMADTINHRGPDGDGFLFDSSCDSVLFDKYKSRRPKSLMIRQDFGQPFVFAHKRLSIVDLSDAAAQPMSDSTQKVWINFNGEIYNHLELRKGLIDLGYSFRTDHSDTEAIIYAYMAWGMEKALEKLRGQFAFALWDAHEGIFFLVRDRIGIKPLYYTVFDRKIYFSSELKAILRDQNIPRKLNYQSFYDYLSFLTVPAPRTFLEGFYKIPAGHYIRIKDGHVSEPIEYWDVFDNVNGLEDKKESEIIDGLLHELREAVRHRMMADVPVGVFLSGGIDSSVNATMFSQLTDERIKTFSIGYENAENLQSYKNEFQYARQVAQGINSEHHELELSQQDVINFLPDLIYYQDEPIADPVCVPVYYVSKLAKDNGVTVCQVGEGSDELFWGYKFWKQMSQLDSLNRLPIPHFAKSVGLGALRTFGQKSTFPYELLRRAVDKEPVFWTGLKAFGETEKQSLINGQLAQHVQDYRTSDVIHHYYNQFKERAHDTSFINWMSYIDLKIRLPELLLMRVDKMAMATSLEARVPFLDHIFVEYAMGIPSALKQKNRESKYILKKAVEGLIPHEIIYRKKQGFDVPLYDWIMGDLGRLTRKELFEFNDETEFFDPQVLTDLFERKEGKKTWFLLNFVLWWKSCIAPT